MTPLANLRQIGGPTAEPLTLLEARIHLRQDFDGDSPMPPAPDDSWLSDKITAAREFAEDFIGVPLTDATYLWRADAFTDNFPLPEGTAEVVAVSYLDADGTTVATVDPTIYYFDEGAPQLVLLPGASWPVISTLPGAVRVTLRGGYGTGDSPPAPVPARVRHAMLLLIGHWWLNREAAVIAPAATDIPFGVEALLRPLRVRLGMA